MAPADDIVARARALVGVRFRPQGRDPSHGLDCVGLTLVATRTGAEDVPRHYRLRGDHRAWIERRLAALGWTPIGAPRPGDLVLFEAGPAQFHLGVVTPGGCVHADAGLRRVVERPDPLPWRIASVWRAAAGDE